MKTWNLDALFKGYDSVEFQEALKTVEGLIEEANSFANERLSDTKDAEETLRDYVTLSTSLRTNFLRMMAYVNLRLATDAQDDESNAMMNKMQMLYSRTTDFNTKFSKWLPEVKDLESLLKKDETLKEFVYHFMSIKDRARFVLSDKEEAIISKMSQTGSSAWSQLQGLLTSVVEVEFDGKTVTLSEIRNKAHSRDKDERKRAYDAEQAAYKKIDHAIAASLNGVKGEVNTLAELRGFESPLSEAVYDSRMQQETLDALISSMRDHLPMFRKYLMRKAKMLGHDKGLPWYDLFAPMGKSEREFSVDEAMQYVIKNFKAFGDDLSGLAKRAYDEEWIDFTPRAGKRGGAFCSNLHPIKQSRILTNFDGSFSNVITLAHELGHAYHGDRIFKESILNASYTMPVAETASTLCETIVKKAALEDSSGDEQLFILEQSLMGTTQIIVDILSRFIFEKNVFEARKSTPLSVKRINQMMLDAQKEAYGEALSEEAMQPYAWLNKPHYYRGSLSFYNFPYAFGLLFAKGIYAEFQKKGKGFVEDIDRLLQMTGQMSVEEVASIVGLDVTKKSFWDQSLAVVKDEIDMFLEITK